MGQVSIFEIKNGANKWVVENQPEKRNHIRLRKIAGV